MMFYSLVIGFCFFVIITVAKDIFISQDYSDLFFHTWVYLIAVLVLSFLGLLEVI